MLAFNDGRGLFWVLFIGNVVFDCSSPMIFNGLSLVTTAWYGEKEQAYVIALIGLLGGQLGGITGLVITGIVARGLD